MKNKLRNGIVKLAIFKRKFKSINFFKTVFVAATTALFISLLTVFILL